MARPSDYNLFGPMKKMLGGRNLHLILNCNQLIVSGLRQQPASFFAQGIHKLVDRRDKYSNEFGQYVEK